MLTSKIRISLPTHTIKDKIHFQKYDTDWNKPKECKMKSGKIVKYWNTYFDISIIGS